MQFVNQQPIPCALLIYSGIFIVLGFTGNRSIKKAADTQRLDCIQINLKGITTKENFLKILTQRLNFHAYSGMN
jgi:hypothetical protein